MKTISTELAVHLAGEVTDFMVHTPIVGKPPTPSLRD
jgi:hypothetical protein